MKKLGSDMLGRGWRLPGRRRKHDPVDCSDLVSSAIATGQSRQTALPRPTEMRVLIYESELALIAGSVLSWRDLETGGHLYGAYTCEDTILVVLATLAGPMSRHQPFHFEPDLCHVHCCDEAIVGPTGNVAVGRYHSHGTARLDHPSRDDNNSRVALLRKNPRWAFLDVIVTQDTATAGRVRLHVHASMGDTPDVLLPCRLVVLPGYSPIRSFVRGTPAAPAEADTYIFARDRVVIDPLLPQMPSRLVDRLSQEIAALPDEIAQTAEVTVRPDGVTVSLRTSDLTARISYSLTVPGQATSVSVLGGMDGLIPLDHLDVPGARSLKDIVTLALSRQAFAGQETENDQDEDGVPVTADPEVVGGAGVPRLEIAGVEFHPLQATASSLPDGDARLIVTEPVQDALDDLDRRVGAPERGGAK